MNSRALAVAMIALAASAIGQSPVNDDCTAPPAALFAGTNPVPIPGSPSAFSNVGATNSAGFGDPCGSGGHQDVFYTYTSTVDGQVRLTTCTPPGLPAGTLIDTMLSVLPPDACANPGTAPLACNDDSCGLQSSLTFTATYGVAYLVRVSSYYPGATGTFYVNVDPGLNDACGSAQPVGLGTVHGSTFGAPLGLPGLCPPLPTVWYATTSGSACDYSLSVESSIPGATLQVFTEGCGVLAPASGCSDAVSVSVNAAGIPLLIAVSASSGADFTLIVDCPNPPPSNDDPSGAIAIVGGVGPDGSAGYFTGAFGNIGATQSPGFSTAPSSFCFGTPYAPRSDVFFSYVPQSDGPATITATPAAYGGAASSYKTMMEIFRYVSDPVYSGYVHIACDDDGGAGNGVSEIAFNPTAGSLYLIRISSAWTLGSSFGNEQIFEGQFQLTVSRSFRFDMDAPLGPGSIRLRNMNGPPNSVALTFLTLAPGAFPNGWLFGLDPTLAEIQLAVTFGAPFNNVLDADGGSSFSVGPGLPSFTLYGVTLKLSPAGLIAGASPPVAFTIP
jgi:hypothetical protein